MSIRSNRNQYFRVMDLGETYEKSQASLNTFKEQIMQCKQLIKSPEGFIKVYFSKLKTQIETDREEVKKAINAHYKLLTNELDMIQGDCLQSLDWKENIKKEAFEKLLKEYEDKFLVLKHDLTAVSKIDFKRWDEIMFESNNLKLKLESMKEDYEEELLMNKAVTYESNRLGIEVLEPVKLITRQLKESVENLQEFGSFHFTKTGFKEFSQTIGAEFRSTFYSFNNIKWYAELENEDGENMGAYVYCIRQRETQEIMTMLGFQLNNKQNAFRNDFGQIEYKFTTENGHGYPEFISFEEIFQDGFYDEQNDSIDMTIFIQVKYIREYLKTEDVTPRVLELKPTSANTGAKLQLRKSAKTPGLKSAKIRENTSVPDGPWPSPALLKSNSQERMEQMTPKIQKSVSLKSPSLIMSKSYDRIEKTSPKKSPKAQTSARSLKPHDEEIVRSQRSPSLSTVSKYERIEQTSPKVKTPAKSQNNHHEPIVQSKRSPSLSTVSKYESTEHRIESPKETSKESPKLQTPAKSHKSPYYYESSRFQPSPSISIESRIKNGKTTPQKRSPYLETPKPQKTPRETTPKDSIERKNAKKNLKVQSDIETDMSEENF